MRKLKESTHPSGYQYIRMYKAKFLRNNWVLFISKTFLFADLPIEVAFVGYKSVEADILGTFSKKMPEIMLGQLFFTSLIF